MVLTISEQKQKIKSALIDLYDRTKNSNDISETVSSFNDWAADCTKSFYTESGDWISSDSGRKLSEILTEIMEQVAAEHKFKNWSVGYFGEVAKRLTDKITFVKIK